MFPPSNEITHKSGKQFDHPHPLICSTFRSSVIPRFFSEFIEIFIDSSDAIFSLSWNLEMIHSNKKCPFVIILFLLLRIDFGWSWSPTCMTNSFNSREESKHQVVVLKDKYMTFGLEIHSFLFLEINWSNIKCIF